MDRYVTKALQNASPAVEKHEQPSRYVFLNELVKETRDPAKIRAEVLNILLAGRDTTASLLTIAFHILPKYPDVEKKLRADIDQLSGELPTFEALKNLKYLRYFLNECQYLPRLACLSSPFTSDPSPYHFPRFPVLSHKPPL